MPLLTAWGSGERPIAYASIETNSCRTEVCTSGERSFSTYFWVETFSPASVWTPVHLDNRQEAPDHHPWSLSCHSHFDRSILTGWGILLSAYNYMIQLRSTKEHTNVDGLLCLPFNSPQEQKHPGRLLLQFGPNSSFSCHCSETGQLFKA